MRRRTKPARAARAALVLALLLISVSGPGQGLNNLWLGGYDSDGPPPFGGVDLDFQSGNLVISTESRAIGYRRTSANISDASGVLIFSTNGAFVANALGDTMLNGSGLSPGWYADQYPEGFAISQGVLILPKPEAPGIYYLFHSSVDVWAGPYAQSLYLTTIDISLDGGLGGVTSKNQVILSDDLNVGRLTAVRHANGRDWWVFCHKLDTDVYYRFLVTPFGVNLDGTQSIGVMRGADGGQACFSPDGSKFVYYWGEPDEDLDIFHFDRCMGLFSNPTYIPTPYSHSTGGRGVAFSPNGRYLYVSSVFNVHQYDTEAADVASSMVHIAEWDSTYSPFPPQATLFNIAQLAPDGKVYISTGNGTDKLHVIHSPDSLGLACNIEQHGIALPRYFSNSLPNHPNYHLGPVDGTICDSLGINASVAEQHAALRNSAYPNPSNGQFTLSYPAQAMVGALEVRDLSGRLVLRDRIPQWSQVHAVELRGQAPGLYQCTMRWLDRSAHIRVLLE